MSKSLPSLEQLLEAGVHFGHNKDKWNPKMAPFVFTTRENLKIIDLEKTQECLSKALDYVDKIVGEGKIIVFVGTKKQAQGLVAKAEEAGMPYVNRRWFGGTLTNFETIKKNLDKMKRLEKEKDENAWKDLTKYEQTRQLEELEKLQDKFGGIKDLNKLPDALFIVDTLREKVAIKEARNLDIPIIALVDTNSDPSEIDYPVPANDDAIKSLDLLLNLFYDKIKVAQKSKKDEKTDEAKKDQEVEAGPKEVKKPVKKTKSKTGK